RLDDAGKGSLDDQRRPHRLRQRVDAGAMDPDRSPSKRAPSESGPSLLLITASSPEIQRIRRSRFLNFQQITMPYLGAYVPGHWTVRHIDEAVEAIDFE